MTGTSVTGSGSMWGGRFETPPSELFRRANDSLPFDWALVEHDIQGSMAWARALVPAGVLSEDAASTITEGLAAIAEEARRLGAAPTNSPAEDVHTWVEMKLIERVGAIGKKLHTGRSRNDQVSTDLRLWCRAQIDEHCRRIDQVLASIVRFARASREVVMPGYTHLQRAQPILLAHWAMAYAAMFERDRERLIDARRRVNRCPLGAGALAGTAYPIDREVLAASLEFDGPTDNSLDTSADRDFVAEVLAAQSLLAMHISKLGEELVLFGSGEFGFFEYDDAVASGSSIMPQKKNPDAAEIMRGKAGRIQGHLVAILTMLKGLPLAYNKDLQEDKEPLFDASRQITLLLELTSLVFGSISVNEQRCREAALQSYTNATELADYLVGKGVAFRDAHHQVGQLVRDAIEQHLPLEQLTLDALKHRAPSCEDDVFEALTLEASLARRDVIGGTAPRRVLAAIEALEQRLGAR